jgi:hypothetical protein
VVSGTNNEAEVYFALYGSSLDPDAVTTLVGLTPTSVRQKGKPMPKEASWIVSSGRKQDEFVDVYDLGNELVSKLAPYLEQIVKAKNQLEAGAVLQVVLTLCSDESKAMPVVGFSPGVIDFTNRVGASIDVDMYRAH